MAFGIAYPVTARLLVYCASSLLARDHEDLRVWLARQDL